MCGLVCMAVNMNKEVRQQPSLDHYDYKQFFKMFSPDYINTDITFC